MTATTRQLSKKACLLGDMSVGKTSLVRRYVQGRFDDRYLSTLGAKVSRKVVGVSTDSSFVELSLLLWDIAGGFGNAEPTLRTSYLRGTAGALLVCDLTRTETLYNLTRYAHRLRVVSPKSVLVLAANKVDLVAERQIGEDEFAQVADKLGAVSFFTSAKTGAGVEDIFLALGHSMMSAPVEK